MYEALYVRSARLNNSINSIANPWMRVLSQWLMLSVWKLEEKAELDNPLGPT